MASSLGRRPSSTEQYDRIIYLSAPKGVNGRNSDNTPIEQVLSCQPSVSLRDGMEVTYRWIYDQIRTKTVCAQHRSAARERRRIQIVRSASRS
jgi:hypothetical protein